MKTRLKKHLQVKANWVGVFTLIFAIGGFLISFIFSQVSYQIISGMFVLIAVENFLMRITYMDDIKHQLEAQKETDYSSEPCNYREHISEAKECIFFNGIGLVLLCDLDLHNHLSKIDAQVSIKFVVAKHCEDNFQKVVLGGLQKAPDIEGAKAISKMFELTENRIREHRSLDVTHIDFFAPVSYFAVDYKEYTESSFIQAKHYLLNREKKGIQSYYCSVRPGSKLYEYYRQQIILLDEIKERI